MANPRGNLNLQPFTKETASAAGKKSAEARRAKAVEREAADAAQRRDIAGWIATYEREQLSQVTAAAAQKIAHMILDGEITDQKALVQALPYLVDITRLEEGKHTTATMHATISGQNVMDKITALREQASNVPALEAEPNPSRDDTPTVIDAMVVEDRTPPPD